MADDLKKIKDLVEIILKKTRGVEVHQSVMADQVRIIKDQQSVMNEKLDNHTEALVNIEDTLKGYSDMYEVNKEKTAGLGERVDAIENKLAVSKNN